MNFNFNCLDVKLSNMQSLCETKISKLSNKSIWDESFSETLAMSSNWESVKLQVHNASSFWNDNHGTVFMTNPFTQGRANENTVLNWLKTKYNASNYPNGFKMNVTYFEWRKNPALHNPPARSLKRFGRITLHNNVFIRRIVNLVCIKQNNSWVIPNPRIKYHTEKPCLTEYSCDICWGVPYYPEKTDCILQPTYYTLSCLCEPEIKVEDPCDILNSVTANWDFIPSYYLLEKDSEFKTISSTDLSPFTIGIKTTFNPALDILDDSGFGVYKKYVNNSNAPIVNPSKTVNRKFAFNTKHSYYYDSLNNKFILSPILSSSSFSFSNPVSFPIKYKHSDLFLYMKAKGIDGVINQASPDCSFTINIITSWYRWETNDISLSATPYWHIGTEIGNALGFPHMPIAGQPDPPENWEAAKISLGDSLRAYFGTLEDLMGEIKDINLS